jgi:hypothetical protein
MDYTTLHETERRFINTKRIGSGWAREGEWFPAYSMFRNPIRMINDHGPRCQSCETVAEEIVFYSYFKRPAFNKSSLIACAQDVEIAERHFLAMVARYRPKAIVFLSRKAYSHCQHAGTLPLVVVTPHPCCVHWNRVAKAYGGTKGSEILAGFVAKMWQKDALLDAPRAA